jgi:lipoprotein-anchoring transpeptidase ErfK/SrfK
MVGREGDDVVGFHPVILPITARGRSIAFAAARLRAMRGLRIGWTAALVAVAAVSLAACGSSGRPDASAASTAESFSPVVSDATAPVVAAPAVPSNSAPAVVPTPKPTPNACAHNAAAQLVLVDLSRQHLWLCARHRLVKQTPITSGMSGQWTETPRGHYTVQGLERNTTLTLNTGATYAVKYWVPFDGPLFGFHDSSWQAFPYGSAKYKTDGSHGCVHMPLRAIAFLYGWARVGAKVYIHA